MTVGTTHALTDLGNSERLVELHGEDLRHVGAWSRWLAYDGRRWAEDDSGGAMRCAVDTSRVLVTEAGAGIDVAMAAYAAVQNDATAKALKDAQAKFKHAVQTQSAKRLQSMLELARSNVTVAVSHDQLDADPMLLNVENGTIDLRTGELRPHRRADLITKLAPVHYQPAAECPTWERFVMRAMHDDHGLVDYLARVVGYTLTGLIVEHVLGFFFGAGANGKTTFFRTLHAMLGDYAAPAPRGLLFRSRGGERHPTELAVLHGRRFVTCAEIESGQAFDEALVKDLTGGDLVVARRMREDFWKFQPTHKLFIAGNHKPTVRGDDEGIWRRMRLIPWTVTIPAEERDRMLPDKLRGELGGILAWAVRGCLDWQRRGLGDPPDVVQATADYREESDTLGDFFSSRVTFEEGARVPKKSLRDEYRRWCEEQGFEQLVGPKVFAAKLYAHGVKPGTWRDPLQAMRVVEAWHGVRLATDPEREARVGCRGLQGSNPGLSLNARARERTNGKRTHTDPYSPTDDLTDFLEREGVQRG